MFFETIPFSLPAQPSCNGTPMVYDDSFSLFSGITNSPTQPKSNPIAKHNANCNVMTTNFSDLQKKVETILHNFKKKVNTHTIRPKRNQYFSIPITKEMFFALFPDCVKCKKQKPKPINTFSQKNVYEITFQYVRRVRFVTLAKVVRSLVLIFQNSFNTYLVSPGKFDMA